MEIAKKKKRKSKPKRKLTPEEIRLAQHNSALRTLAIVRKRGLKTRLKNAKKRAKLREKEKEKERIKKAKQRERERQKRLEQKKKQLEKEKAKRAKERAERTARNKKKREKARAKKLKIERAKAKKIRMRERAKIKKAQELIKAKEHKKELAKQRKIREKIRAKAKAKREREKARAWEKEKAKRAKAREKMWAKMRKKTLERKAKARAKQREKTRKWRQAQLTGKPGRNRRFYFIYFSKDGVINMNINKIGAYTTPKRVAEAFEMLKQKNSEVIFEVKYNATKKVTPANYEYVVFRKIFPDDTQIPNNAYLKNEYGKLVEHKVEGVESNFVFYDKMEAKVEETIWVYGYNNKTDRKTFMWILENIVYQGFETSHDIKRVYLYHNKVVLRNDADKIDIIILKCFEDAIRYYNLLMEYCKTGNFLFMGNITTENAMCPKLEELLIAKTGWDTKKLRRNKNRF